MTEVIEHKLNDEYYQLILTDCLEGVKEAEDKGLPLIFSEEGGVRAPKDCSFVLLSGEGLTDKYLELAICRYYDMPFTIAESRRLYIREISVSDLDYLPQELKWEKDFTRSYIAAMYKIWGFGLWLLIDKKSGEYIGRAGVGIAEAKKGDLYELGYEILAPYRRQGYGYEACRAILEYAREELGLENLIIRTDASNTAAIALAKKLGISPRLL